MVVRLRSHTSVKKMSGKLQGATAAIPLQPTRTVKLNFSRVRGWFKVSNPAVEALFKSKTFWAGLGVKLVMSSLLGSYYMRDLFIPFLNYFAESHFANPWSYFEAIGKTNSFPYPPVMLYLLAIPRVLFMWVLPHGVNTVTWMHLLVMRLPLLACDIFIAMLLVIWFPGRHKRILAYYWCSPLTLYALYWHGQLDIIPTALFLGSLHLIRIQRTQWAMLVFGLSLAAKTHLFAALPFLFVYLLQETGVKRTLWAAFTTAVTYCAIVLPYLSSSAFILMVFGTQEQGRLIALRVAIGPQMWLLVAPAAILLLWFRFLAYRHRNWDLLMLYLGILFSVFVLLAPPAPGYVLWSLPFLLHFICRARDRDAIPLATYSIAYVVFFWFSRNSDLFDAWHTTIPSFAAHLAPYAHLMAVNPDLAVLCESASFTILQASLAGVILQMYLMGVRRNDSHKTGMDPAMIGVAGDSGSGKNTFVSLIADVVGNQRVTIVAGDDYHRWPRGHQMWRNYTHLDVRANDLYRQYRDAIVFSTGQPVLKGVYDHQTGSSTPDNLTDPGDVMIFQGLHTLSIEGLRKMYDLSIFLDPEESLRCGWKIERDRRERGYTEEQVLKSLAERRKDRETFILPQMQDADLVVCWKSNGPSTHGATGRGLALEIIASNSFNFEDIVSRLKQVESIHAEHEYRPGRKQYLMLSGTVSAHEVATIAHAVVHDHSRLLCEPRFRGGLEGCLQVLFAICLTEKLFSRLSQYN